MIETCAKNPRDKQMIGAKFGCIDHPLPLWLKKEKEREKISLFEDACARLRSEQLAEKVAGLFDDEKLEFYGLFKQAIIGDISTDPPSMLDEKAIAKYNAWSKRKGMSQDEAKLNYVVLVQSYGFL